MEYVLYKGEVDVTKRRISLLVMGIFMMEILIGGWNPIMRVEASNTFTATPYTAENGQVVEGLEEMVTKPGKESWLETTREMPTTVKVDEVNGTITMENEVIRRRFKIPEIGGTLFYTESYMNLYTEQEMLKDEIKPDVYLGLYNKGYHEIYSGESINVDPEYYYIGGNEDQNTLVFKGYEVFNECEKPFNWQPSKPYSSPVASDWPPRGKRIIFKFGGDNSWDEGFKGLEVDVIYEMYDGITAMKKRVEIKNTRSTTVTVGKMTVTTLNAKEEMKGQIHLENEFAIHQYQSGAPVDSKLPCGCKNEKPGSPFKPIKDWPHTCYHVGPAYQLGQNETLKSFNSFELLFSTYWFELKSKEVRGMYTKLFPWITDNPITYHCTGSLTKAAINHAASAGFEMIIQSYAAPDSSGQMLTRNQYNLDKYKDLVDYAHSKGVDVGIYQAQYLLGKYKGGSSYGTNGTGKWGTWCLASAAFDDY